MMRWFSLFLLMTSYALYAEECKVDSDCIKQGESFICVTRTCQQDVRKICKTFEECTIVTLSCNCMYCARATDLENKLIDSVNINHAKSYEHFSTCSSAQIKSCSMAGACAQAGVFIPECVKGICGATFKLR